MSRKKPAKASSPTASKKRLSPDSDRDARIARLRDLLRRANEMLPDPMVVAIYDEIATQARQFGGESANWESPFGRVYLEAQLGLAATTWVRIGPTAAIRMFQRLLEADPVDHALARNWVIAALLQLDRNDEAAALLQRFEDASAFWQFAGALLAFRQHGDRDQSSQLVRNARHCDPGFIDYLLGDRVVNADAPVRFHGKPARIAHSIARLLLPAWRNTPGAAAWARRVLSVPLTATEPVVEVLAFPRDKLRRLPRKMTTWQLGLRQNKTPDHDDAQQADDIPTWTLVVADIGERQLRTVMILEEGPTSAAIWQKLLLAFERPMEGEPARPAQLVVPNEAFCETWRPLLRQLNIACEFNPRPQPVTDLMEGLAILADEQRLPKWSAAIDVGSLPQTDEVWQATFFHSTTWVSNKSAGTYRPWAVLILNKSNHRVLVNMHLQGDPTPDLMLDYVIRTMSRDKNGGRPRCIEVADSDSFDVLQPKLDEIDVACRLLDELPELDELCRELAVGPDERNKCALADGVQVTKGQMESFYYAADAYYRARPWQLVQGEVTICVHCPELQMTRFAVVLGRTGVQLGCCFYDTFEDYQNTMYGGGPDCLRALAVCYDEAMIMAGVDLWYIERNGWPIASPDAYPAVWRSDPRRGGRPPTADELTFVTAALEVIPRFLKSNGEPANYEGGVNGRTLNVRLNW